MKVVTSYINKTEGYRFGDEEIDEEDMRPDLRTRGGLFRFLQKEYGRCVSKVHLDIPMGDGTYRTLDTGWVFERKMKYDLCKDTYLREVWIVMK